MLLAELLPYLIGATAIGLIGGILPIVHEPSTAVRSYIQHLAAGLLLAVIALELTPELRDLEEPVAIIAGLALGGLLMIALKRFSRNLEKKKGDAPPYGMVGAAMIDTFIDGSVVGAGFVIDPQLGILLAVGLGLDLSAVGASIASEFRQENAGRLFTLGLIVAVAIMLPAGAAVGVTIFSQASDWVRALVLSIATAALLYLVTDELLARGQDARDSTGSVASFFVGFIGLTAYALTLAD